MLGVEGAEAHEVDLDQNFPDVSPEFVFLKLGRVCMRGSGFCMNIYMRSREGGMKYQPDCLHLTLCRLGFWFDSLAAHVFLAGSKNIVGPNRFRACQTLFSRPVFS